MSILFLEFIVRIRSTSSHYTIFWIGIQTGQVRTSHENLVFHVLLGSALFKGKSAWGAHLTKEKVHPIHQGKI